MNHGRKFTGAKYHADRKKKKFERKGQENIATLGETKRKSKRVMGGNTKTILLNDNEVNISGKKAEITNVTETPQNIFLARQNRLIKGAVIETSLGKAKITNRPAREGFVNAILVK